MTVEYALARLFPPDGDRIALSRDEFVRVSHAKDALIATIGIEQKFDLLLENYVEYENELLKLALHQVVFHDWEWNAFQHEAVTVTRRLVNLLSAARLYVDQVSYDLGEIFGKNHEIVDAIKRKTSEQYDAKLGYRLMETLRNSLQHRSIAAIRLHYLVAVDRHQEEPTAATLRPHRVRQTVTPFLRLEDLQELALKASVQKELESLGQQELDLALPVREYLDGLATVHYELREKARSARLEWESIIRQIHARGVERWNPDGSGAFDLVSTDPAAAKTQHIFLAFVDYLAVLEKKNRGPIKMTTVYVASLPEP